jgi:hypothetical protein
MKKQYIFVLFITCFITEIYAQNNVGIGTNSPDSKAILELQATDKGILIPRMTATQRNNMSATLGFTQKGLLVFDNDSTKFFYWNGSMWQTIGSGAIGPMGPAGSSSNSLLYSDASNSGNIANTSEQVLKTYILPANTLINNGGWLEIEIFGTVSNSGNITIKVKIGGSIIYQNLYSSAHGSFFIHTAFYRESNTVQKFFGWWLNSYNTLANTITSINTISLNLSTNLPIEITATNSVPLANGIIVQGFAIKKLD